MDNNLQKCVRCDSTFPRSKKRKYCKNCYIEINREKACLRMKIISLEKKALRETKICKNCGDKLNGKSLKRKYCRKCSLKIHREHARKNYKIYRMNYQRNRKWVIEQLGGKCVVCGYNKCIHALEIHHIDEDKKPEGWNKQNKYFKQLFQKWYNQGFIPEEEKKNMILYCSTHHKEWHYGELNKSKL